MIVRILWYIALWFVVLVTALAETRPIPWAFAVAGMFAGAAIGVARLRCIGHGRVFGHPANWAMFFLLLAAAWVIAPHTYIGAWATGLAMYFIAKFALILFSRR